MPFSRRGFSVLFPLVVSLLQQLLLYGSRVFSQSLYLEQHFKVEALGLFFNILLMGEATPIISYNWSWSSFFASEFFGE